VVFRELQEAIDVYSKALESNPQDIVAHMGRGQVFAECGEFNRAIEDLDFAHDNLEPTRMGDGWLGSSLLFHWQGTRSRWFGRL
jgi:tetratricopeptide (TPR) repeat protein